MKLSTLISYGAGAVTLSGVWVTGVTAAPGDAPTIVVVVGPLAMAGLAGLSLALIGAQRPDQPAPDRRQRPAVPSPRPARRALPAGREATR